MKKESLKARLAAFDILQNVLRKKQALDESFDRHPLIAALEKRDRGFVHVLVATSLRHLGQIDGAIKSCLDRKDDLKAPVMDLLRLGAAQLLFLETASHAAVDTSVQIAASQPQLLPYKGLINAVLRRLSRQGAAFVQKQDGPRLNTPVWLWESWVAAYGAKAARLIAQAHAAQAPLDLSFKGDPAVGAKRVGGMLLPSGTVRLEQQVALETLEGFAAGDFWVQDAAAAMIARLLGDVRGKDVLDLCAAPGGKTLQLAAMGAQVTALDRADKRLARLRDNLARTKLQATLICADAQQYKPAQKADFILLDAPCTATGTIRRHPDIPYLKTKDDVLRLSNLQRELLDYAATHLLSDKGVLVYAVCSLQKQEAEDQIEAFLARYQDFERVPTAAQDLGFAESGELISKQGDLRCLPCFWGKQGGMDGFYAARLRRRG
ncbi:MAG: methyltransferase domain-containing protein [Alphaproteobacteria bacterium]|nr:methyltransferase domain-containing protein [Alphaproteobacteria bacterium]